MDGSESTRIAAPQRRPPWRRIAVAAGVWVAVLAAALGISAALDDPPIREQPIQAPAGLPPLRLYLDRDLPASVRSLPDAVAQVERLEELASTTDEPARWVELGAVAQRFEDPATARAAYERALTVDPNRLDAQVGIAMIDGATGPRGLERAAAELSRLQAENPRSQLVAFNRAMIGVYRSDRETFVEALRLTVDLGPDTQLGQLARRLETAAGAAPAP